MKKRLLIASILLVVLSTYKIKNETNIIKTFKIKNITIENNYILNDKNIIKDLNFLYEKNIFSIDNKKLEKKLKNISFIESFEIKKVYPNNIKIKIFEKEPIAILQDKKEKFFFTNKGEIIKFFSIDRYKNLPIIFGNKDSFILFYDELNKTNFPLEQIKAFYYFESKRWDLLTIDGKTIKLPIKNYIKSLENFLKIKEKTNFDKYKVFDYRIKGQLILK